MSGNDVSYVTACHKSHLILVISFPLGMAINKYIVGKMYIQSGAIADLTTFFQHVPKTRLAKDLRMHHDTIKGRIANPGTFTFDEILAIAKLLDVKPIEFLQLIIKEDEKKRNLCTNRQCRG